jgi:hypothetical protein
MSKARASNSRGSDKDLQGFIFALEKLLATSETLDGITDEDREEIDEALEDVAQALRMRAQKIMAA